MIRIIGVHHKDTKSQDQVFLLPLCPRVFVVGFGVQRDVFDYRIHFPRGSKRLPGGYRDRFHISFGG
ncbi:MAG: hypothetical protein QOH70_2681 [Blastocatellia bacterium]|jgi:hypothetical protein|nr:hypothetical protein [Blastocatellia bacterium]